MVIVKNARNLRTNELSPSIRIETKGITSVTKAGSGEDASAKKDTVEPAAVAFKTDTDISRRKGGRGRHERDLEKWNSSSISSLSSTTADIDLNAEAASRAGKTSWDQFAVNERLFGLKTDFDEEIYTTPLGKHVLPPEELRRREAEAGRLALEITKRGASGPMTTHQAEERGLCIPADDDMNEEDRYGAVIRSTQAASVSTEEPTPVRKSSIDSLGELPAQAGGATSPIRRRKSLVEQVSEDMTLAMNQMLLARQQAASLNPNAPEFCPDAKAPEFSPQQYQQQQPQVNPYAIPGMPSEYDAQIYAAMLSQYYYQYDPYAINLHLHATYGSAQYSPPHPQHGYHRQHAHGGASYYQQHNPRGYHQHQPSATAQTGHYDPSWQQRPQHEAPSSNKSTAKGDSQKPPEQ